MERAHSVPLPVDGPALPSPQLRCYTDNSKSTNTRKAYRIDWDDFVGWCQRHRCQFMPARPETIAEYLVSLAEAGARVSTIQRRLASISVAHRIRGSDEPNPARSGLVATTVQGIRNTLGTAQDRKAPLVTSELARILEACSQLSPMLAARDRALLLIGAAGGLRRSELVALDVADVVEVHEGLEVTIRRSKTDQTGEGATVGIPYGSHVITCPVRTLRTWLRMSGIAEGPLWREVDRHGNVGRCRLHASTVPRIIKRACELAGIDPAGYSGHSLRAGMATSAAQGGAQDRDIMRQGRWRNRAMVDRYVRSRTIWEANAAAFMGL